MKVRITVSAVLPDSIKIRVVNKAVLLVLQVHIQIKVQVGWAQLHVLVAKKVNILQMKVPILVQAVLPVSIKVISVKRVVIVAELVHILRIGVLTFAQALLLILMYLTPV